MTAPLKLSTQQRTEMAELYATKQANQEDLAFAFDISRTSVRRILREFNLCKFKEIVSTKERNMLDVLETFNIQDADKLSEILKRGLQC